MKTPCPVTRNRIFHAVLNYVAVSRNRHVLLLDLLIFALAPLLALMLRLEGLVSLAPYIPSLVSYTAISLLVRLLVFYRFGLYRRYWRYATVDDLVQIVWAVIVSTLAIELVTLAGIAIGVWHIALPRSVPILSNLLVFVAAAAVRFFVRLAAQTLRRVPATDARRVLIIGAGSAGQIIVKELLSNPALGMQPVGFIDDDPAKRGMHILSLPVFGGRGNLVEVVKKYSIEQAVIAMPEASGKQVREFLSLCEVAGIAAKTVPGVAEILDGKAIVSQVRNVQIEDLLRREPIQTDIAAVRNEINGKRVLITGGGGSIGSELARQLIRCKPAEIVLLGHGENSLFEASSELSDLARRTGAGPVHVVIADIRFSGRVRRILGKYRPEVIFHAAAHKHVPLMELNPEEAITNNIFGTKNLLDAALEWDVERFVLISSDKAVNPTSVMGASKRVAELLLLNAARQCRRPYVAVRFGNVLGSRGSVVLTFKKQIATGKSVTVSHPDMRRYFMTIPEAVQLVLQASVLGKGGEIFLLDMGEPVRVVDLARDLIELSGLQVGTDIDITYIGIRPGEKLFEELYIEGEVYEPTRHEKVMLAKSASGFVPGDQQEQLRTMERAVESGDSGRIIRCLKEFVPEFEPDNLHDLASSDDHGFAVDTREAADAVRT